MRRALIALLLVSGAAVLFVTVRSVYSTRELFTHITPDVGAEMSTSMEPYELTLKTKRSVGDKSPDHQDIREWRLILPRAYLFSTLGNEESVSILGGSDDTFAATLKLYLKEDGSFVPWTSLNTLKPTPRTLIVGLQNNPALQAISGEDLCVPQNQVKEVLGSVYNSDCRKPEYTCLIYSHAGDWGMHISATQDLYADPARTCKLVQDFLQKQTTRRDSLRQK